jgi:SWI/SNF chromatin-remodeling complex subunit SWI1
MLHQQQQMQPDPASAMDMSQPQDPSANANTAFMLDPANAAKQMAALQAAGRSRAMSGSSTAQGFPMQQNRPNPPPGITQNNQPPTLPGQQNQMAINQNQQQRAQAAAMFNAVINNRPPQFLQSLAEFMNRAGRPLPPSVTGIVTPSYDPNTSQFRMIQGGSVPGTVKIANKDVDLHALLVFIIQRGGGIKVNTS